MGGGLLAGSLCVSVGLGRWNLVWCVCSGLAAALCRPLHWAPRDRKEELTEERERLEIREIISYFWHTQDKKVNKGWNYRTLIRAAGCKKWITVVITSWNLKQCGLYLCGLFPVLAERGETGISGWLQKVLIFLIRSELDRCIFQQYHQISSRVLRRGFHWTSCITYSIALAKPPSFPRTLRFTLSSFTSWVMISSVIPFLHSTLT